MGWQYMSEGGQMVDGFRRNGRTPTDLKDRFMKQIRRKYLAGELPPHLQVSEGRARRQVDCGAG
jgi:hypothetical protein